MQLTRYTLHYRADGTALLSGLCSYLAIVPGIVGHAGFNTVLKYLSPLVITLSTTTEPLIGACIGAYSRPATGASVTVVVCA